MYRKQLYHSVAICKHEQTHNIIKSKEEDNGGSHDLRRTTWTKSAMQAIGIDQQGRAAYSQMFPQCLPSIYDHSSCAHDHLYPATCAACK